MSERLKSPRLLDALENRFRPTWYRKEATMRPGVPLPEKLLSQIRIPKWEWNNNPVQPRDVDVIALDGNADYLAAASSVRIGVEQLEHTGEMPERAYKKAPGYYLIRVWNQTHPGNQAAHPLDRDPSLDLRSWTDRRFISPLGESVNGFVWVCEPTLTLLTELARADEWFGSLEIHDSWTAEHSTSMHPWTAWVNEERLALKAMLPADDPKVKAFKLGYAVAIQMLPGSVDKKTGKDQCLVKRPDWYHAIRAQHRANQWRKTWNSIKAGVDIVAVGGSDVIYTTEAGMEQLRAMAKPTIRLDPLALGAYKEDPKERIPAVKKPEVTA